MAKVRATDPGLTNNSTVETATPVKVAGWAEELNNFTLGRGHVLVPFHDVQQSIVSGGTESFEYYVRTREQARTILILVKVFATGGNYQSELEPTVDVDGTSTTHNDILISHRRDVRRINIIQLVHRLPSATSADRKITLDFNHTIEHRGSEEDDSLGFQGIGIWEIPRNELDENEADFGVDEGTVSSGEDLVDDTASGENLSAGGVWQQTQAIQRMSKGGLFTWSTSKDTVVGVSSSSSTDVFSPGIHLRPRQLMSGETEREVRAKLFLSAGTSTDGAFWLAKSGDGDSGANFWAEPSAAWSVAELPVPTEDLSTADGERSTADVHHLQGSVSSGSNNLKLVDVVCEDIPFVFRDVRGVVFHIDAGYVQLDGSFNPSTVLDKSGNNHDNTGGTAPSWSGRAITIDSSPTVHRPTISFTASNSEYYDFGDVLDLGDNALYIAAVVQGTNNSAFEAIISKRSANSPGQGYVLGLGGQDGSGNTKVDARIEDGSGNTVSTIGATVSGANVRDGNPHLIEMAYIDTDGGKTLRVFIDKTQAGTSTNSSVGTVSTSLSLGIGAQINSDGTTGNYFDNELAHLIMYHRAVAGLVNSDGSATAALTDIRDEMSERFDSAGNF